MSDVQEKNPGGITEEQKIILRDVFQYRDKAEYTDDELALARQMFDTPEKFALLRKILQVLTPEERGITMPDPRSFVDLDSANAAKYAFDMAVLLKTDETIRQMLVQFYRVLRGNIQETMKADFETQNQADFEEKKRTEEYEEGKEAEERTLGENL